MFRWVILILKNKILSMNGYLLIYELYFDYLKIYNFRYYIDSNYSICLPYLENCLEMISISEYEEMTGESF